MVGVGDGIGVSVCWLVLVVLCVGVVGVGGTHWVKAFYPHY